MASPPHRAQLARRNSNAKKQHLPNIEISRRSDHDQPLTTATITAPSRSRLNTGDLKRKKSQLESSHNATSHSLENVSKFSQRSSSSEQHPEDDFSPKIKSQRVEEEPPIQAQTPTELESQDHSSTSLAGHFHTGLTQQYSDMNFDISLPPAREFSTPRMTSADATSAIRDIFGVTDENANSASDMPPFDFDESLDTQQVRLCDYKWAGDLGSGGSSVVYKGTAPGSEYEFIAIKRFENPSEDDPEVIRKKRENDRSQALNEVNMLRILGGSDANPTVIKMGRYEEEKDYTYLELELMDISLHDFMNQPQNDFKQRLINSKKYNLTKIEQSTSYGVDLDQLGYWAACAVDALFNFHENSYCHGDIKSGNFLLKYQPRQIVKLADLGLTQSTKTLSGDTRKFFDLTGTPSHHAPEMWMTHCLKKSHNNSSQYFEREEIRENLERFGHNLEDYIGYGCAVDIWALGCVLVHLATGKQLYYKGDSEEFMYNECMEFKIHECKYSYRKALEMMPSYLEDDANWKKFINFLEICLEHSPTDRATAYELLHHPFLIPEEEEDGPSPT